MTDEDIAWAAGFFEGEGSSFIAYCNPTPYYRISINQAYREPLDKFCSLFGGKVYGPYGPYNGRKAKPQYQVLVDGTKAIEASNLMLPFLFAKGDQVRETLSQWHQIKPEVTD